MRAVILAGGQGTRLRPYTTVLPKPLMPVGDMPILEIVLRQLKRAGFSQATLAVSYLGELIQAYCGDGSRFGLRIDYSRELQSLSTAGPLKLIPGLDDTFLVMNGDLLTTLDYRKLFDHHRASGAAANIAMHRRSVKIRGRTDVDVDTDDPHRCAGLAQEPHQMSSGKPRHAGNPEHSCHAPAPRNTPAFSANSSCALA